MCTQRIKMLVLALLLASLSACQTVGNKLTQDAKTIADETSGMARTGMADADGTWSASGPQMSGTTSIDGSGIARNNTGVADSMFYWNGEALAVASNADLRIVGSKFYTPDGTLIADIGELSRDTSAPTRASNESLDRMIEIVKTMEDAKLQAFVAQAQLGDKVAQAIVGIAQTLGRLP